MVRALDSGSKGPGSSPGRVIMLIIFLILITCLLDSVLEL